MTALSDNLVLLFGDFRNFIVSKPADLVSHLCNSRYDGFCSGCGYFAVVHGHHRGDCTALPRLEREAAEAKAADL